MRHLLIALTLAATPALGVCEEAQSPISGSIGVVSDYRYRGYSLSDEQPAIQAELTATSAGGWYADVWTSTIDEYAGPGDAHGATVELDLSVGRGFSALGLDWDAAASVYTYPGASGLSYWELPVSASRTWGDLTGTAGLEYAPSQSALGDEDNRYVYLAADWAPESWPVSLSASIGLEDGAFADNKLDWAVGVARDVGPVNVQLQYIDADAPGIDGALVASLTKAF
jgi:uncharacterized protein (TIGR02001 family)